MTISREELAAFADGELDPARAAEVAAAVANDGTLQAQVEAHRSLKAQLGAHFAPIHDAPVPDKLSALLVSHEDKIVSFAMAKEQRDRIRRWSWVVAPALAASLALAVFLPRGAGNDYAQGQLAATLDGQLVASRDATAPTQVLLSFRDHEGDFCRAFVGETQSGIACRDDRGWRLQMTADGIAPQTSEYRTAGSPAAAVVERAQELADGPALDAAEEQAARARGWR